MDLTAQQRTTRFGRNIITPEAFEDAWRQPTSTTTPVCFTSCSVFSNPEQPKNHKISPGTQTQLRKNCRSGGVD